MALVQYLPVLARSHQAVPAAVYRSLPSTLVSVSTHTSHTRRSHTVTVV